VTTTTMEADVALRILRSAFGKKNIHIKRLAALSAIVGDSDMDEERAGDAIVTLAVKHELYFGPGDTIILPDA
jgi:hypothetical protein